MDWEQFIGFLRTVKYVLRFGAARTQVWNISPDKSVAYMHNSRACSEEIGKLVTGAESSEDFYQNMHILNGRKPCRFDMAKADELLTTEGGYLGWLGKLPRELEGCYKFTYVRNPYERLVSTYNHKYHVNKKGYYHAYLFGYIEEDEGFDTFVRKVCRIPARLYEEHLSLQYLSVYRHGKPVVDYIGKFEEIDETLPVLIREHHLGKMFERRSATDARKAWRDYYTIETAELVHRKYYKDFKYFGYEKTFRDLITYLREKESRSQT